MRTDNTMSKINGKQGQSMIHKILHRKLEQHEPPLKTGDEIRCSICVGDLLKIEQHEPPLKTGVISGARQSRSESMM